MTAARGAGRARRNAASASPLAANGERFPHAVHLALGASLLAVWTSNVGDPAAPLVVAAVLAWAVFRERRGKVPPARIGMAADLASLAYLLFFAADVLVLSRNLLAASMRLLAFLSILRLLVARTDRERMQLLLVSFLSVIAATASTTEISFALPLAIYVVAALWALGCRQADLAGRRFPPTLRLTLRRAAAVMLVGLGLFFLIPHVGTGYFRAAGSLRQELSGFSGRIELGSINRIKKNHEIVMRVALDGSVPPGVPLRWRGMAFDQYDGRAWSRTVEDTHWMVTRGIGVDLGSSSGMPEVPRLAYEVTLEPIDSRALFAAPEPLRIDTDDFFNVGLLEDDGGLRLYHLRRRRVRYRMISELRDALRLGDRLPAAGSDYPQAVRGIYLQLPALDPRLDALAAGLSDGETNPYRIAAALERNLRSRYTYSLDVQDAGVADPLARFLIEKAPGHCEYFATSMAILCRKRGVPARVVTGFLRGEHSDLHGTLLVRQSDAHSWVEVYFPGHGWIAFDPTPPEPVGDAASLWARLLRGLEEVEIAWDTWIVGLDLNDQASVLLSFRDTLAAALRAVPEALGRHWRTGASMRLFARAALGLLLLAALLAGAARLAPSLRARLRRRGGPAAERDRLVEIYRQFLEQLARRGIRRASHLTPLEFARDAALRTGMPAEVEELTGLFCRARYGGAGLSAAEAGRAEELIRRLRAIPSH